jgi:hypothetical protein
VGVKETVSHRAFILRMRLALACGLRIPLSFIIAAPFLIYKRWDPFYHVMKQFFPTFLSFRLIHSFLRTCMGIVCYVTCVRSMSISWIFLFGFCVLCLDCLSSLWKGSKIVNRNYQNIKQTSGRLGREFTLSWLQIVQTVFEFRMYSLFFNATVDKYVGNTVTMGIGLVSTVVISAGFATIRLTDVVPLPYYMIFPLAMVLAIVGVFVWFPCALKGNDMCKEVKVNWCRQLHVFPVERMKYVKRVVEGVKIGALRVMLGEYVFLEFDRGTQTGCFKRTLEYLITACLSIS